MASMVVFSSWLAQTQLSIAIADRAWTVPLLQSVHIISVAIVLSSVAMLDLRLAGVIGRGDPLRSAALRFYPWIWGALAVLILTGFFQIMAEPARELLNWIFWTKMGLIITASLITAPLRSRLEELRIGELPSGKRNLIRGCALLSLALWVGVVICGRWIAYAGGPTG